MTDPKLSIEYNYVLHSQATVFICTWAFTWHFRKVIYCFSLTEINFWSACKCTYCQLSDSDKQLWRQANIPAQRRQRAGWLFPRERVTERGSKVWEQWVIFTCLILAEWETEREWEREQLQCKTRDQQMADISTDLRARPYTDTDTHTHTHTHTIIHS